MITNSKHNEPKARLIGWDFRKEFGRVNCQAPQRTKSVVAQTSISALSTNWQLTSGLSFEFENKLGGGNSSREGLR